MDFKSTIFPTVEARFLKYVSFPTQSSESSESCPSTEGQRVLATYIVDESRQMGVTGAALDPEPEIVELATEINDNDCAFGQCDVRFIETE